MKKIFAFACILMLPLSYTAAEGYQVNSQSAKQAGMGHVGAALKLGAESMHFNPAGLAFMNNSIDLSAGVSAVISSGDFKNGNYKHKIDNDPSTPLYFYAGFKVYDFLAAGISVTNPYGSAMNWGKNWEGSHLIQDISLKSFSIQPTVAFKIGDRLSVGGGLMVMFGDFSLSRALISSNDIAMLAQLRPELTPIADKYKGITPIAATLSGDAGLKLGYNLGAMFDLNDKITIGVSYRSKVKMEVEEGTAALNYANETELKAIFSTIPPLDRGTFEASLPLPSNVNVGVSYKPTDKLLLSGEVQFVGWGAYKALNVQFSQEVLEGYSINAEKNYKNSRIYRIGGQYATTDRLDLRLGFYFDETPVKDEFLNPETPSMNKLGMSAGLSFRPLSRLSVDFAMAYTTGFGRDGSYTDVSPITGDPRRFPGHYKIRAFTPTIGLSYSF
ncbi:long-chain fatty acid transport protein [Parabacteroides sp. PF5-5]|uniref:OmpP1/FadL family transporter n=1 Tax=unclassified Parabacteroides TaxID=2649774 RepID=UPI0024749663|nr:MULTISPECIES: outer membrane protein transport protein [unclassified Parabacteroides]MDH6305155.1 long-chain fatty acid transport protein [Parabacteroides sp. PH5-39]MDH6316505.1 long-chain fatty acid transport protein [Parabacteroides sp. PF5-13]MDH6320015.1 long-chain fatty acid transport protein [Parabacteroides sp. PH5-13]MDH6323752.1 long-chain fatty acid transport protein [Parabacteroides sp. PH5-8]MDH6327692.1 long-chain fatty acid transport protein [Parabacteroides sp. PH5-41]